MINRVNAGAWGPNDKLGSPQINALDINTTYALDKRSGQTDTLQSVVTINSTGVVNSTVSGGIVASATGAIQATATGGIASTFDGGIQHRGSGNDWVGFNLPRSRTIRVPAFGFYGAYGSSTFTATPGTGLCSPVAASGGFYVDCSNLVHHGATLVSCTCSISVDLASTLPTSFPSMSMTRFDPSTKTNAALLSTGPARFPTSPNLTAWVNGGATQTWTYTCDQNNVVDRSRYQYLIAVGDANNSAKLYYMDFALTFSVSNMQFP